MRILKVIHAWQPEGRGGTEAHAAQAAHALAARGHQVGVFARTGRPDRPEYEVTTEWQGNVGITRVNNNFQDSWSFSWLYKNEHIHQAFEREIDEFKPDLIHVHHLTTLSTTIVEAAKSRGLPLVMTLHDFWTACPRGQRMMKDLHLCDDLDRNRCYSCLGGIWPQIFADREREPTIVNNRGELSPQVLADWDRHMAYVLDLADLLITPSAFHRERMLEIPLDPARIISLPHGMDHAPFDTPPRSVKPVQRIGFIGAVIPVKGVHVLIEAFRRLDRPELTLEIFGDMRPFHDDVDYEQRLRELARGFGNINFHGEYAPEQVPTLLADLDILVVPSLWWETFCLTIREGMLAGIPVVASDLGAMREALDGEKDGIFFQPGDVEDLRDKLELLIDNADYRERFLNRGSSVKTLTEYVEELEEVYADAVRIARRRQTQLVVAPPFFPAAEAPGTRATRLDLNTVPWDDVAVTMAQQGSAAFAVQTKMPVGDDPSLGVGIRVTDGGREIGSLDLNVDLEPLGDAAPKQLERVLLEPERSGVSTPSTVPAETKDPAPASPAADPAPVGADAPKPRSRPRPSNGDRRATDEGTGTGALRRSRKSGARGRGTRKLERKEPGRATRHELGKAPGSNREDVPQGGLPTERWNVKGPVRTRKVPVDES